jgi:hypothetical protein
MTAIDFPNSPSLGQIYIVSGKAWRWSGEVWDLVGSISQGPIGPTGPGSTIPGPTGPRGSIGFQGATGPTGSNGLDGSGISILGKVANIAALPSTGNSATDAYLVESENEIYVWDVAESEWFSLGPVVGPTGPTGAAGLRGADSSVVGPTGPSGPTGPAGIPGPGYDGVTINISSYGGNTLAGTLNKSSAIIVGSTVRIVSNANPEIFADGTIFSLTGLDASITIFFDNTGGTLASLTNPKVTISAARGAPGITTSATEPPDTTVLWNDPTDIAEPFVIPAGGAEGTVLTKATSSDYDTAWNAAPYGTTTVTSPIVNTGNSTNAVLEIDKSQFIGTGNAIINGAFEINQRNFTSSTVTGYAFDRWQNISAGDGTTMFSSQAFALGSAPVVGYEATNHLRIFTSGQTNSSVASLVEQRIEGVRSFAGQTVTVSFFAKSLSGSPQIALEMLQNFGSSGSASVFLTPTKIQISTTWIRYSATFQIPSIAGKTIGTGNYLRLLLWVSAGADNNARTASLGIQNNTFDIWGVQLEAGAVATPFRRNAPSIQAELAACQRYYVRFQDGAFGIVGQGPAASSSVSVALINSPVTMRVPPISMTISGMHLNDPGTGDTAIISTTVDGSSTRNNFLVVITTAATLTVKRTYVLRGAGGSSPFIDFSAEL